MAREKRRNSEKRKEKSRDAARCRRGKESEIFSELAQSLPLGDGVAAQLDKASIMRLTISMLKQHNILDREASLDDKPEATDANIDNDKSYWDHLQQKALDGFAFILSHDGDIVYLSESVGRYLGLQQIELIGQSIYEFAHPCDHEEIKEMLTPTPKPDSPESDRTLDKTTAKNIELEGERRTFLLRLKCTLTSKGRNVNLKSATYKTLKFTGRLLTKNGSETAKNCPEGSQNDDSENDSGLDLDGETTKATGETAGFPCVVGVAEPIAHPANIEVPLDCRTFVSKHSMDMHFLYCDERIDELAGFSNDEMVGQSFYDFHHGLDSDKIEKAFKDVFSKGQAVTEAYRFLAKTGGYMWVLTQATVINNSRTMKPLSVVCVHYVISGVEQRDQILSNMQEKKEETGEINSENKEQPQPEINPALEHLPPKMELSTENIFAPKTKDMMNQSYFVPPELKDSMTYLNEEPADLSYLAPNAGDDFLPVIFPERDVLLSPNGLDVKSEPDLSPAPDMCYRKNQSPASIMSSNSSSRIGSPKDYLSMTLPEDVEVIAMDNFFQSMNSVDTAGLQNEGEEIDEASIDFAGRAPYIPMDGDQDLGLSPPNSGTLFSLSEDLNPGLFGQTEYVFGPKQSLFETPPQPPKLSIQDMLGGSTAVASIEQPEDTMLLQMKRPLDMNSLEKGPPKPKVQKLQGSVASSTLQKQPQANPIVCSPLQQHTIMSSVDSQQQARIIDTLLQLQQEKQKKQVQQFNVLPTRSQIQNQQTQSVQPILINMLQQQQPQISGGQQIWQQLQQQPRVVATAKKTNPFNQKQVSLMRQQASPSSVTISPSPRKTARQMSKDSLLLNLLLSKEDGSHKTLLPNLTSQECEVNAPASTTNLLQGKELLSALEGGPRSNLFGVGSSQCYRQL